MFLMIRCSGMASLLLVEILSELHQELDESLFSSDPSGYACDGQIGRASCRERV